MSTKVYNGTIIEPTPNLKELDKLLCDYTVIARQKCQEDIARGFVEATTQIYDERLVGIEDGYPKEASMDMFKEIIDGILENNRKSELSKIPEYNFTAEVHVCLTSANRLISYVSAEKSYFYDAWLTMPGIRDYAYWNNSDADKNVSKKEWSEREEDWDFEVENHWFVRTIIGKYAIPYEVMAKEYIVEHQKYLPTLSERIDHIAHKMTYKDIQAPEIIEDNIYEIRKKRNNFIESDIGQLILEKNKNIARAILENTNPLDR